MHKLNAILILLRLSLHFGPLLPFTRTGKIRVFDIRFPFCSRPSLSYLEMSARGTCHEPATCRHMIDRYAGKTVTILDIGAYYGYFTSFFGAMNADNTVHAFEPNPLFVNTLQKNFAMNCRNGACHAIALSDSAGSVPFKGRSMKVDENDAAAIRVPAIRFDDWVKDNPVRPDVVKLDVHGSEGKVLFGMQNLLNEGGFDLYFELHPDSILADYRLKEIIALLYDTGWEMAELPDFRDEGTSAPVPLTPERRLILEDPEKWTDREHTCRRMFFCQKKAVLRNEQ